eukprot:m.258716 g.258716  ORF g.258716 m.258716 type:complete len:151 (-) comp19648_c0_seq7:170-622(-)
MCAACNVVADVARQRQTDAKTPLALGAQGALVLHLDTARDGVLLPALVSDLLECTGIKSLDDRTHSMQTILASATRGSLATLGCLMKHLKRVIELTWKNKATPATLADVFAPIVFRTGDGDAATLSRKKITFKTLLAMDEDEWDALQRRT